MKLQLQWSGTGKQSVGLTVFLFWRGRPKRQKWKWVKREWCTVYVAWPGPFLTSLSCPTYQPLLILLICSLGPPCQLADSIVQQSLNERPWKTIKLPVAGIIETYSGPVGARLLFFCWKETQASLSLYRLTWFQQNNCQEQISFMFFLHLLNCYREPSSSHWTIKMPTIWWE